MNGLEMRPFETSDLAYLVAASRRIEIPDDWLIHGLTVTQGGQPVAVGGLVWIRAHWWTFAEITEPARRPMLVHRLVLGGIKAAERCGIERMYGYCDETYPRARSWIERMGFRPATDADKDDDIRGVEAFVKSPAWIREGRNRGH